MKIFFDTEFTGLQQDTDLMSIGLVSENGLEFYAELNDYRKDKVNDWIKANVENNFTGKNVMSMPDLRVALTDWLGMFDNVEMWSDCLAYDWVLFCEIWFGAFNVPQNIYYIPFDLSTLLKIKGFDPDVNREEFVGMKGPKHNALHDAWVIKRCHDKAMSIN